MGCIHTTPARNIGEVIASIARSRSSSSTSSIGRVAHPTEAVLACPSAPVVYSWADSNVSDQSVLSTDTGNIVVPITAHRKVSKVPTFKEYSMAELNAATDNFHEENLIVEVDREGWRAQYNQAYRGRFNQNRSIIVKRFTIQSWPDAREFTNEAIKVGQLRHENLANLLGFCCQGDERILISEYMPNGTLAEYLYDCPEGQTMVYALRLRVALHVAQVLIYCANNGFPLYHDLNIYRVLFDEEGDPRLSCFGLVENNWEAKRPHTGLEFKFSPPEYLSAHGLHSKSVIYNFGILLLDLFRRKRISPQEHGRDLASFKTNILTMMDTSLQNHISIDDAKAIMHTASCCLMADPSLRPTVHDVALSLLPLQRRTDTPSWAMMKAPRRPYLPPLKLSQILGKACARNDLGGVYMALLEMGYRSDTKWDIELSSKVWPRNMQDLLIFRNLGDRSFRDMDFRGTIAHYTELSRKVDPESDAEKAILSATGFLRRSLAYVFVSLNNEALADAMHARELRPEWPPAYSMQGIGFDQVERNTAKEMLTKGSELDN